ncbi:hypothetical protein [Legionella gresilensis]|uniref:hypothetical protein n=1 Tax=Legionella gresilensis TaxID=91823 RepID=UPI00104106A8|nr:hypothetical protein [Legionella gresilensis]
METKVEKKDMKFIAFANAGNDTTNALQEKLGITHKYTIGHKHPQEKYIPLQIVESNRISIEDDNTSFVILGHTSDNPSETHGNTTLGGYDAEGFASRMDEMIAETDRSKVKHFYLVACEVGMSRDGNTPALAQKIAFALENKGFREAKVHAITNNSDNPGESMVVTITSKAGTSKLEGHQNGHVTATSFHEKNEKIRLADTGNIIEELQRPQHTFDPINGQVSKKIEKQEKFIELLQWEVKQYNDTKHIDAFTNLLKIIKNTPSKDWNAEVITQLAKYRNKTKGSWTRSADSSTFYTRVVSLYVDVTKLEVKQVQQQIAERAKQIKSKKGQTTSAQVVATKTHHGEKQSKSFSFMKKKKEESKKEEKHDHKNSKKDDEDTSKNKKVGGHTVSTIGEMASSKTSQVRHRHNAVKEGEGTGRVEEKMPLLGNQGNRGSSEDSEKQRSSSASTDRLVANSKVKELQEKLNNIAKTYDDKRNTHFGKSIGFFPKRSKRHEQIETLKKLALENDYDKITQGIQEVIEAIKGEFLMAKSSLKEVLEEILNPQAATLSKP